MHIVSFCMDIAWIWSKLFYCWSKFLHVFFIFVCSVFVGLNYHYILMTNESCSFFFQQVIYVNEQNDDLKGENSALLRALTRLTTWNGRVQCFYDATSNHTSQMKWTCCYDRLNCYSLFVIACIIPMKA